MTVDSVNDIGPIALVTGLSKTGAAVTSELIKAGARPRIIVRDKRRAALRFGERVEVFSDHDYTDPNTVRAAFDGAERVFLVSGPDADAYTQTTGLIDVAKASGVAFIVRLSVYQADQIGHGFGASYVGQRHRAVERYIEDAGLAYSFLRPTWFMQNFELFCAPVARATGEVRLPLGDAATNYIDLGDIARVAAHDLMASDLTSRIRELATDELSPGQAVEMLSRAARRDLRYLDAGPDAEYWARVTPREAQRFGRDARTTQELQKVGAEHWARARCGEIVGTTDVVRQVTGQPPITFADYARERAHMFR